MSLALFLSCSTTSCFCFVLPSVANLRSLCFLSFEAPVPLTDAFETPIVSMRIEVACPPVPKPNKWNMSLESSKCGSIKNRTTIFLLSKGKLDYLEFHLTHTHPTEHFWLVSFQRPKNSINESCCGWRKKRERERERKRAKLVQFIVWNWLRGIWHDNLFAATHRQTIRF